MADKTYILAHDIGTTGNKTILMTPQGKIVASTYHSYPTNYLRPNWVEQDPADWKKAVFEGTRQVLENSGVPPQQVAVVSFSGHMNGVLLVDKEGEPLRQAIIWADQRATEQAEQIRRIYGKGEVYSLTGNRVSPAYSAAKLLWIKENEKDIYKKAFKMLQVKDYAAYFLSGIYATDFSDASLTQMLDLGNRTWAKDFLDELGITPSLLPDLHPSAKIIGQVTREAAELTGLLVGTPVVIGGGDGACATVGAASINEGDVYTYIGSSSWVGLTTRQPLLDEQQRTFNFCHPDPDLYVAVGSMQSAGGAFDWLENLLGSGEGEEPHYDDLNMAASLIPAGGNGLIFLPYLLGERSPYWNPLARSAFIGLAMPDGQAQLARAVMEGVAFNLRMILDILRSQGRNVIAMQLIGGGSRSTVWRQIMADIFELPILLVDLPASATAMGAAVAGGIGVGLYANYGVVRDIIPVSEDSIPDVKSRARYKALYGLFQDSYQALVPIYERLSALPK